MILAARKYHRAFRTFVAQGYFFVIDEWRGISMADVDEYKSIQKADLCCECAHKLERFIKNEMKIEPYAPKKGTSLGRLIYDEIHERE